MTLWVKTFWVNSYVEQWLISCVFTVSKLHPVFVVLIIMVHGNHCSKEGGCQNASITNRSCNLMNVYSLLDIETVDAHSVASLVLFSRIHLCIGSHILLPMIWGLFHELVTIWHHFVNFHNMKNLWYTFCGAFIRDYQLWNLQTTNSVLFLLLLLYPR